jgi:hypothetical protein
MVKVNLLSMIHWIRNKEMPSETEGNFGALRVELRLSTTIKQASKHGRNHT